MLSLMRAPVLDRKRLAIGRFAAFAALALTGACAGETTNFDSGGGGKSGGATTGGSAGIGSGTGGASRGGSTSSGGSNASGRSSTGGSSGASSGGSGASPGGGAGGTDAGGTDASGGSGATSGTGGSAGGAAGGPTTCNPQSDAMDMCGRLGASCLCCPIGGPAQACICTTECTTSADCHDAARPVCNIDTRFTETGICAPDGFICRWGSRCAAPNTPIATPSGERPISELRVGDLVYSIEGGAVVVVPIHAIRKLPVTSAHTVSRVTLASGAVLEISAGHPTAEGRSFGDLQAGDDLGGARVKSVTQGAPYAHPFTHDILPDSSSGTYFAAGALIGSTLAEEQ